MKRWLLVLGLVGLLLAARPVPVIQVTAVAQPLAELEAGSYRVTFQVTADEMTTLWHTNSDFLFVVWDVWTWQPGVVEFVTAEPVTLYAEGFGCYQVCGKIRGLQIERLDADIGGWHDQEQ